MTSARADAPWIISKGNPMITSRFVASAYCVAALYPVSAYVNAIVAPPSPENTSGYVTS